MRRRRVPNVINDVSNELLQSIQVLKNYQGELLIDIEKIKEVYSGNDALMIVSKFKYYLNILDNIIDNYDYWTKYLSAMTDYDLENIQSTVSNLESIDLEVSSSNLNEDDFYNTTLNIKEDLQ